MMNHKPQNNNPTKRQNLKVALIALSMLAAHATPGHFPEAEGNRASAQPHKK